MGRFIDSRFEAQLGHHVIQSHRSHHKTKDLKLVEFLIVDRTEVDNAVMKICIWVKAIENFRKVHVDCNWEKFKVVAVGAQLFHEINTRTEVVDNALEMVFHAMEDECQTNDFTGGDCHIYFGGPGKKWRFRKRKMNICKKKEEMMKRLKAPIPRIGKRRKLKEYAQASAALHSVQRRSEIGDKLQSYVQDGDTVSIRLGAVGLAAAEGARIAGASRIIGVDLNPARFDEAKKFGVTEFVNPKDYDRPVQEVLAEMTNGGVDRSVECTGNVNAMISAFECVHDGWGVAVLVGVPHKDAVFKTHPMNFLNERTLKGTFFGNYKPRSDLPSVVEMYLKKELELEKFITHEVPFSEINKAFDYMLQGVGIRCIIRMDG